HYVPHTTPTSGRACPPHLLEPRVLPDSPFLAHCNHQKVARRDRRDRWAWGIAGTSAALDKARSWQPPCIDCYLPRQGGHPGRRIMSVRCISSNVITAALHREEDRPLDRQHLPREARHVRHTRGSGTRRLAQRGPKAIAHSTPLSGKAAGK